MADLPKCPVIFEESKQSDNFYASFSFYHLPNRPLSFLHYHNVLEIGKCIQGSGVCCYNGKTVPYHEGDVQFFLPFQPHYNISDNDNTFWNFVNIDYLNIGSKNITADYGYLAKLVGSIHTSGIFNNDTHPSFAKEINDLIRLSRMDPGNSEGMADLFTSKTLMLLQEMALMERNTESIVQNTKTEQILPAIHLVSNAIEQQRPLSVHEMAESCLMSESHFRKIFSESVGQSPKSYLIQCQIRKAAQLLISSNLSISEIMWKCGFTEQSTFYRRFTKVHGMSPTEYRNNKFQEKIKN